MLSFIIGIVALIMIIMNIVMTRNRLRRAIVIIDIGVVGVILCAFLLNAVTKSYYRKYEEDYNKIGGTILNSVSYEGEDDDYFYVEDSYMFGSSICAIPKENCECGPLVKIAGSVYLYIERGQNINLSDSVEIGGRSCYLAPAVVRIVPDFWEWQLIAFAFGSLTIFVGNVIVFIIFVVQNYRKKGAHHEC